MIRIFKVQLHSLGGESSFVIVPALLCHKLNWLLMSLENLARSKMGNVSVAFIYGFEWFTKNIKGIRDIRCYRVRSLVPLRRKTGDVGTRSNQKNQYGSAFKENLIISKL